MGALGCDGESARAGDFGGAVKNGAEVHEGTRGACGALAVGVADAVAVEAKYSKVHRNGCVFEVRFHVRCSCC